MTPSHFVLGINDSPWDKMTPLQDVMVASGSALESSTVAKVAIFATLLIQYSLQEQVPLLIQHNVVLNYGIINMICLTELPCINFVLPSTMYHVSTLQKL